MENQVFLIAAFGMHGQVGLDNDLPWRIPAELKHFRETTSGFPIIMGRVTAQAIEKPLAYRRNIVISNTVNDMSGFHIAPSVKTALSKLQKEPRVFIIGGPQIWESSLDLCTHLVLSQVDYDGEADSFLNKNFFKKVRENFRLCLLKSQEGFSVSYWMRNDLCPNPLRGRLSKP